MRGKKTRPKYFQKSQPVHRVHGSNTWVGRKNIAGQGDPTRDMTRPHGSFGAWWVGAGRARSRGVQTLTGQVGWGREVANLTGRVG